MGFFESDEEENQALAQVATEPELRDWRGKPIEVGTRIVYPGRHSSRIWMTEGEVIEVGEGEDWAGNKEPYLKVRRLRATSPWRVSEGDTKPVKVTALHQVTVVY